jgi:hypothetical protein
VERKLYNKTIAGKKLQVLFFHNFILYVLLIILELSSQII